MRVSKVKTSILILSGLPDIEDKARGLGFAVNQKLMPGMICSNEPGFYKEGAFGIRLENLVVVTEGRALPGGERKMMEFETITLAPIDLGLVEPSLLSESERAWLNAYHARVRETLSPQVDDETRSWLVQATRAI